MTAATEPLPGWAALSAGERVAVWELYVGGSSLAETADRLRTSVEDVARTVQSAYRRVAVAVLAGDDPAGRQLTSAGTRSTPG